ncbi:HAD-superfamily subfamily IB hydrolase, TIGR01490 [Actinopolyspora xinjiangensis]|uniref:HAD-superfamily subfamily IB hydrolase, TIGR01490 n=1 Tax=Actinopolyspora xinjiangensis TaxID=405564 RepID=A0A1H0VM09_9ACTN|nr:HAD-IB family hydrolase [Actinopolyspora xinjiangensis]SDP79235.1 HAD-superfamily subfamily IB hydrolase, TIGR01490 [Actinopolyspora xinjiangensis]
MCSNARAAFFDVDETLTTGVSMFRFLRYYLEAIGNPPEVYQCHRERLREMNEAGAGREETNRAFYGVFEGSDAAEVASIAEEWFAAETAAGGFLNPGTSRALRTHRERGEPVVLVSGSFPAPLEPLREHVRADHLLCTLPEIDPVSGRYTGSLRNVANQPMIGDAKVAAVESLAAAHGIDLGRSVAYGDHVSDLPLLELTGEAVVVDRDPGITAHARDRGWSVLPSAPPGSLPAPYRRGGAASPAETSR